MRHLMVFLFIKFFVRSCSCKDVENKEFHYEIGHRVEGDALLTTEIVERLPTNGWHLFNTDTYAHYSFFQKEVKHPKIITKIVLVDMHKDSELHRKAIVDFLRGGVGKTYVQLVVASLRNYGFIYKILIYGKEAVWEKG